MPSKKDTEKRRVKNNAKRLLEAQSRIAQKKAEQLEDLKKQASHNALVKAVEKAEKALGKAVSEGKTNEIEKLSQALAKASFNLEEYKAKSS